MIIPNVWLDSVDKHSVLWAVDGEVILDAVSVHRHIIPDTPVDKAVCDTIGL
jgi:hypothetical protein